jgi:hypothetical protein
MRQLGAPASNKLQKIQRIADAVLLDTLGHSVRLSTLTQRKITLLTFFHTYRPALSYCVYQISPLHF